MESESDNVCRGKPFLEKNISKYDICENLMRYVTSACSAANRHEF